MKKAFQESLARLLLLLGMELMKYQIAGVSGQRYRLEFVMGVEPMVFLVG